MPSSHLSFSIPSHPSCVLKHPITKYKKPIKLHDLPNEILIHIMKYVIQDQSVRNPDSPMTRELILISKINHFFHSFIFAHSIFW